MNKLLIFGCLALVIGTLLMLGGHFIFTSPELKNRVLHGELSSRKLREIVSIEDKKTQGRVAHSSSVDVSGKFPPMTEEAKQKQDMIWKSGVEIELNKIRQSK